MAARKVSAATRERRRHQVLRDKLWRRLREKLDRTRYRAGQEGQLEPKTTKGYMDEALFLLDALRDTGAK